MKKIIHVENSEFFRKLMRTFLEKEGFEVESFDSAQEANFSIGAGSGDMVITAMTFHDIDGFDFVHKILESFSGPVIVVSSSVDKDLEEKLLDLGIRAALSKSGQWQESLKPHLASLKNS
ncbi:MAG: response regulator [Treponema sp.]|nr:response regulator [Treponema sp.]